MKFPHFKEPFISIQQEMTVKAILRFMLGAVMVGGFLVQMWDLFVQFRSGMKAIAISNEDRDRVEFPSFAFCHSKAFNKFTYTMVEVAKYNSSTFHMEGQIKLIMFGKDDSSEDWKDDSSEDWEKYTSELLPTLYNGYCMLYEFQRTYPPNAEIGKFQYMHHKPNTAKTFFRIHNANT